MLNVSLEMKCSCYLCTTVVFALKCECCFAEVTKACSLHHRTLWVDPSLFNPKRFLNENGELNKSLAEKVLIFGMGIRKCLGEEVARNEIFVILTTVLQKLRLEKPPEDQLDLSPLYGLALTPKPYQVKVLPRI